MSEKSRKVPYIRANEINFAADHLKPYKAAHFFFDSVSVDEFVQKASTINLGVGYDPTDFNPGESVYCSDTGAYATVIAASPTSLYLNENFSTLGVECYASQTFSSSDFVNGDIVFAGPSSDPSANVYVGKVEYFDVSNSRLVLKQVSGSPVDAVNSTIRLYNIKNVSGHTANVLSVGTSSIRFPESSSFFSVQTPSKNATISSYVHNHGNLNAELNNQTSVEISSQPSSSLSGSKIYITSGSGLKQNTTIIGITGKTLTLSTGITVDGSCTYSLGNYGTSKGPVVDEYGILAGVFQIPETSTYKFKTGTRVFTITDSLTENDPDCSMRSTAEFDAYGILDNPDKATPVVNKNPVAVSPNRFLNPQFRSNDPVAQTFFTPQPSDGSRNYGIFVSSIDLFFKNKPDAGINEPALPITLKIVKTLNGYPIEDIIAVTSVSCDKVNVSSSPDSSNTQTLTKFSFDDPVYLLPSQQYAIVVSSDSPSYELWISELGGIVVNDANNLQSRRVSEQPYVGSFFRSQNASTWTPYQNEDLMFVVNKASFIANSPISLSFKVQPPTSNVGIHNMLLHSSDVAFTDNDISYSFVSTLENNLTHDSIPTGIEKDKIFNFASDLKTSSKNSNRKRIILAGNSDSMIVNVSLSTTNSDVSPIINKERISLVTEEYVINSGGISNSNITITDGGGGHTTATNIVVTVSSPQLPNGTRATANVLASGLVSGNVVAINIIDSGSGYVESPTITIQESGVDPEDTATAIVVSEDSTFGGNALARYITKKVVLADGFDAGDLRVYLDAIRPAGTDIIAYYKVMSGSDSDSFDNKSWRRMYLENDIKSPDIGSPIELSFRPSEFGSVLSYTQNGIKYPLGGTFKYFSIKLVMLANDSSVPPVIQNMRAMALPGG